MSVIALFAHPGHELRALGWCMRHRPAVAFLTTGQGSTDKSRLATSTGILSEIGCRVSPCSGSLTDREVYAAMLENRPERIAAFFDSVLEEYDEGVDRLIFDRTEGFNPAHDLVGILGSRLAAGIASRRGGVAPIARAISLETLPGEDQEHPDSTELCRCTDEELEKKLRLARAYSELALEVTAAIQEVGIEPFRTEWGHRIDPRRSLEECIPLKPAFEVFGEERVSRRIYSEVLRRDAHLIPFLRHLLQQLRFRR